MPKPKTKAPAPAPEVAPAAPAEALPESASPAPAAELQAAPSEINNDNIHDRLATLLQAGADPASADIPAEEPQAVDSPTELPVEEPSPVAEVPAVEPAPEDSEDPKAVAQKRIDKLIAQRSQLQEELESAKKELETLRDTPPAAAAPSDNPMSGIRSEAELQSKQTEAEKLLDWVEDQLISIRRNPDAVARALRQAKVELKDTDGQEDYSPESMEEYLLTARRNLDRALRVHIPQRRQFIQASHQFDAVAAKRFPWLTDKKTPEYALAQEVIKAYPGIQARPDWRVFIGVHTLGLMQLNRQELGANGRAAAAPAPRVATATAIPARVDPRKATLEKAREKLQKGDPIDYLKSHLIQGLSTYTG